MQTHQQQLIDDYIKGAQRFAPNLAFGNAFSFYSGEAPSSYEFEFLQNSSAFKGTGYEVSNSTKLIHYTSIQAALNIIQSQTIRLSQVCNLNDPHELKFINETHKASIDKNALDTYKSNLFLSSFSNYDSIIKNDEYQFPMWRLYGGDGKGVGLVFEIDNLEKDISHYYFGKIHYGNNSQSKQLGQLLKYHKDYNSKHKSIIRNQYPIAYLMFMLMHKQKIWKHENEIRIVAHYKYDKYSLKDKNFGHTPPLSNIIHTINSKGFPISYLEMPLSGTPKSLDYHKRLKEINAEEHYYKMFPHLRLKEVILGYSIPDFSSTIRILEYNLSAYKDVIITESPLRKYFY
jgi:hypothetical protein